MIELQNISKIYAVDGRAFFALNGVSITINRGEMIAVQGKSGAGKSTLLHILGCLDTFERGSYLFDGEEIAELSPAETARIRNEKIGFVLQDFSLINHKTALYNVKAPMLFGDTPLREMKKKALAALDSVGVLDQAEKPVTNMSGGQRQRVAIARAIVNSPELILADESTGNLDSSTAREIMEIFCELHRQGKTVVIVTHDDDVAAYCQRKIVISDGKIVE